jgi:hypothetical protein
MAGVAGLEPVTSAVTGQRSNQLSYTPAKGGRLLRRNQRPTSTDKLDKKRSGGRSQEGWIGSSAEKIDPTRTPKKQVLPVP